MLLLCPSMYDLRQNVRNVFVRWKHLDLHLYSFKQKYLIQQNTFCLVVGLLLQSLAMNRYRPDVHPATDKEYT